MFRSNYKWSITFKNCESPWCTPVTYNIVHQLYLNKILKIKNVQVISVPTPLYENAFDPASLRDSCRDSSLLGACTATSPEGHQRKEKHVGR